MKVIHTSHQGEGVLIPMWIYLNDAYLSIADPRATYAGGDGPKGDKLLVRARFEGDIERVFGEQVAPHVVRTPDRDYAFRLLVDRQRVAEVIAAAVREIDYLNFKGSVREKWRHDAYLGCWSAMEREQERRTPRRRARGFLDHPAERTPARRRGLQRSE